MPRNVYLNPKVKTEQNLYEDIIIEALSMYGQETFYIPRELANYDEILGDASASKFDRKYRLMMYIENAEGFDGEGDLFTKFGIELRDEATFVLARRSFQKWIQTQNIDIEFYRPREGDLIYLELSKSLFEIIKVETESPFYQLGDLPVFKLRAQLFEYSGEDFDTGYPDIDSLVEVTDDYKVVIELEPPQEGTSYTFNIGENITTTYDDGVTLSGEVIGWDISTNTLILVHISRSDGSFGMWSAGNTIVGSNNNTSAVVEAVAENMTNGLSSSQNDKFSEIDFVDFSESNPFGDV
jgi:hypothetical protein